MEPILSFFMVFSDIILLSGKTSSEKKNIQRNMCWWWLHCFTTSLLGYTYMTCQIVTISIFCLQLVWSTAEARWLGRRYQETAGGILGVGVGLSNWQLSQLLLLHVDRPQWTPVDFKNSFPLFSPLVIVLDVDLLADYRCNLTLLILMNWFLSRKI